MFEFWFSKWLRDLEDDVSCVDLAIARSWRQVYLNKRLENTEEEEDGKGNQIYKRRK